jgi:hypothetical protein
MPHHTRIPIDIAKGTGRQGALHIEWRVLIVVSHHFPQVAGCELSVWLHSKGVSWMQNQVVVLSGQADSTIE